GILNSLQDYKTRIQTAEEQISTNTKDKQDLIEQEKAIAVRLKQSQVDCDSLNKALSKISIQEVEDEKTALDASIEDMVEASAHWKVLYSAILEKNRLQQELNRNKEEQEKNRLELDKAVTLLKAKFSEKEASSKMLEKAKLAAAESVEELRN